MYLGLLGLGEEIDDEKLLCAVVCNVHSVVQSLREHPDISPLVQEDKLSVVGAYFSFNGVVSFFDDDNDKEADMSASGSNGNPSLCLNCSAHASGTSSPASSPTPTSSDGMM